MGAEAAHQQRPALIQQDDGGSNAKTTTATSSSKLDPKELVRDAKPMWEIGMKDSKEWNTKNLSQRLLMDTVCAGTAGGLVAPIVSMIDKYVGEDGRRLGEYMLTVYAAERSWKTPRGKHP